MIFFPYFLLSMIVYHGTYFQNWLNKGISDEEAEDEYIQILAAQGAPVVDEGDREKEASDLPFDYDDEAAEEQTPTENSTP